MIVDIRIDVAGIAQFIPYSLNNILERIRFVFVAKAVDFVDEHLDIDMREGGLKIEYGGCKPIRGIIILILCVDDPDKGADLGKDLSCVKGRVEVVQLARKVPNLEVHE